MTNPGSPGKTAVKTVCGVYVYVCVQNYAAFNRGNLTFRRYEKSFRTNSVHDKYKHRKV